MDTTDQKEILVVDDTPASLQLLTRILTDRGYRVRPASNGWLALRSVSARLPDLILLDVKMPDMDGFEVCRRLKSDRKTSDVPVLFISAMGETADKIRGFEAGGVDYITKPFEPQEVAARVEIQLKMSELAHNLQVAKESLEKRVEERTAELAAANSELQTEIGERRRVEETLQLMKFSLDHTAVGAHLIDKDARLLYVNDQMCRSLGYSRDELLGMSIPDIDPDFPLPNWRDAWAELKQRGSLQFETRHRRKDGSIFPVEITANYVVFSGKEYNWAFAQDISVRKQTEKELRRTYYLTKTIIDSMNDAISLINVRDFTIASVNSVFLNQYGYSHESELRGKHCYEVTHHRPDVCSPPNDICPLIETVRTKEHFAVDHVHYGKQGEKIYVEVSTSPIKDENGNVIQVVHVQRNITDRKRAEHERELLLSDLSRSNKELKQFAYVASHDLQEPLRMVTSFLQLLERRYKGRLDEKADGYIQFAVEGVERMQKLIEALLSYSRVSKRGIAFKRVDTNAALSQALLNLAAVIRETGAAVQGEGLPTVSGDETLLIQLFQNLIGNGIKYQKPGIRPQVSISAKEEGDTWVFSVKDNGIGIEQQHFEAIFQIFQRLHARSQYSGTGIGLAICKRIVERHHGRIWVDSAPGRGTTFFFTIPANQPLEAQTDEDADAA